MYRLIIIWRQRERERERRGGGPYKFILPKERSKLL